MTSLQMVTLAGKPQLMDLVWRSFENSAEALSKLQPAQNQAKKQCSLKDCLTEVIGSMKDIDPKNVSIPPLMTKLSFQFKSNILFGP